MQFPGAPRGRWFNSCFKGKHHFLCSFWKLSQSIVLLPQRSFGASCQSHLAPYSVQSLATHPPPYQIISSSLPPCFSFGVSRFDPSRHCEGFHSDVATDPTLCPYTFITDSVPHRLANRHFRTHLLYPCCVSTQPVTSLS